MAVITNNTYPGWSRKDVTGESVRNLIVKKFHEIVTDYSARLTQFKTDKTVLEKGFWYPNDYYKALKETGQKKRLEWFVSKNAFYHGYPPKSAFEHISEPNLSRSVTGLRLCGYQLKEGIKATQGLEAIEKELCFIDCLNACYLAYYKALREIYGDDQFNSLFGSNSKTPLLISPAAYDPSLHRFMSQAAIPRDRLQKGDLVVFTNFSAYSIKHPLGEAGGFNAFCSSVKNEKQLFLAFGFDSDISEDQILERLADEFNAEPLSASSLMTENAAKIMMLQVVKMPGITDEEYAQLKVTKEAIRQHAGFLSAKVISPNISVIKACLKK